MDFLLTIAPSGTTRRGNFVSGRREYEYRGLSINRVWAPPLKSQDRQTDVSSRDQPLGRRYLGCCSVFGLAASSARLAIHASYSGVPRRGGVSAGRPPIACGIKSPTCALLQDGSGRTARQRNADLIAFATRLISDLCRRIVAPSGRRGAVRRFPILLR